MGLNWDPSQVFARLELRDQTTLSRKLCEQRNSVRQIVTAKYSCCIISMWEIKSFIRSFIHSVSQSVSQSVIQKNKMTTTLFINTYYVTRNTSLKNTIKIPNTERAENKHLLNYVPQIFLYYFGLGFKTETTLML